MSNAKTDRRLPNDLDPTPRKRPERTDRRWKSLDDVAPRGESEDFAVADVLRRDFEYLTLTY